MLSHVKVLSILMLFHGAALCVGGLLIGVMMTVVIMTTAQAKVPQPNKPVNPSANEFEAMFIFFYFTFAAVILLIGILNIFAGIRLLKYRGRRFGIIALSLQFLPIFTCYCAPTSIALMIYGLVVLLDRQVAEGFKLGEAGMAPDDIAAEFASRRVGILVTEYQCPHCNHWTSESSVYCDHCGAGPEAPADQSKYGF